MKDGMQKYIKICINKESTGKISSVYEDKQEHNTKRNTEKKGNLRKELGKLRNDIKTKDYDEQN